MEYNASGIYFALLREYIINKFETYHVMATSLYPFGPAASDLARQVVSQPTPEIE